MTKNTCCCCNSSDVALGVTVNGETMCSECMAETHIGEDGLPDGGSDWEIEPEDLAEAE